MKYSEATELVVIFGAGKIARGFVGHLLYLSGIDFLFVEKAEALCALINERKKYTVNVLGAPEKNCVVQNARALNFSEADAVAAAIAGADAVFGAVGGKNLPDIVPLLTKGIEEKARRGGKLNIVTCENWKRPADVLREGIEAAISEGARAYFQESVGITEAVVMRSAIEADASARAADPLVVNVQNYWELHVDAARLKGALPDIRGLHLIDEFSGFLERKFYTYNAANGTVSYLGALLHYKVLADAAHDERILAILDGVYGETARALSKKHHFPLSEQLKFAKTSLAKLQDYTIVDTIERNARDPMRKLGPDDRLVGSARLCLDEGVTPEYLAIAIAAALHYESPGDPSAEELDQTLAARGAGFVLESVCKLEKGGALYALVLEKERELVEKRWIQ
jgi:mannitol-1-phosphate 5-dehydrogenase